MAKKITNIAIMIEFLTGSGLAIFFHMVLNYEQAAMIIFGTGILLSLATYLLREDIGNTRRILLDSYHNAHEIPFAVAGIRNPECLAKAHELLAALKRTISMLQQGYIPLDETEFYLEGAKCLDQALSRVKAVDPFIAEWESRGALFNLYHANLRALSRGVRITRIFVANREDMADPVKQKILLTHYRDNIDVRIVLRDELPAASDISGRDTNSSFDFAIFDDSIVTEVFGQPGKYYGRKTSEAGETAKFMKFFDLIEHNSRPISVKENRVVLAGEPLLKAS